MDDRVPEALAALTELVHGRDPPRPHRMTRAQLQALPGQYRLAVARLAEARARGSDAASQRTLEHLVLRGHALLYALPPPDLGMGLRGLWREFFAQLAWRRRAIACAALIMVCGAAFGYAEVWRDPTSAAMLLPGGLHANAEESFQANKSSHPSTPLAGVFYFTNNARVALAAFALGTTAGVGTVLSLIFNGVVLGATLGVVRSLASVAAFASFVLPHAGIELFAICVAAGGGLHMAHAIVRPGWVSRRRALAAAARDALPLALGAAALLGLAGLVEGWISPMPWPLAAKAALGLALDSALAAIVWRSTRL